MNLLPKDDRFFQIFQEQASVIYQASDLFKAGLKDKSMAERLASITALEQEGDELVRKTAAHLQETFLAPFEPIDVRRLSKGLDDILVAIEEAAFRITTYCSKTQVLEVVCLADVSHEACQRVVSQTGKWKRKSVDRRTT